MRRTLQYKVESTDFCSRNNRNNIGIKPRFFGRRGRVKRWRDLENNASECFLEEAAQNENEVAMKIFQK